MTVLERTRRDRACGWRLPAAVARGEPRLRDILAILAAFVVVWTLYYTITEAPVAIKHDMAEAYAWGQEFQLGYNQHPPFWAWICGLWFCVLPHTGWAFALLSSLNAGIGLWGAWRLIGNFATGRRRLAAWLLLLLTPLYTFYAYKYDANIIFISLWPWTLHCFVRSMRTRGNADAVALGVMVGLALMSKYYALILIATCFLASVQHAGGRKYFASACPYIAVAVAALICAPHVWWLLANRAPPLHYLDSVSGEAWRNVLTHAGKTLSDSVGMNLGVLVVVGWVAWRGRRPDAKPSSREPDRVDLRLLATLALAPLVLTIASALIVRTPVTAEMVIGTFPLLPLLVIETVGLGDVDRLCRVSAVLACVLTLGSLLVAPGFALYRTYWSPAAMKAEPFQEMAKAATRLWHERTGLKLAYVAGSAWYDNETAFYSPDHPHSFAWFSFAENLWVTPQRIARHGLLSICVSDDKRCLADTAKFVTPASTRTEMTVAHRFWGHRAKPVHFVVTVIPPIADTAGAKS